MVGGERLWRDDDFMQVALHEFCDDISSEMVKEYTVIQIQYKRRISYVSISKYTRYNQ